MTALRRQTVFAGLDQPESWPATRGRPQPQRLERELDVLPGVGATLKRKLAKLGLVSVRRPRSGRFETLRTSPAMATSSVPASDPIATCSTADS